MNLAGFQPDTRLGSGSMCLAGLLLTAQNLCWLQYICACIWGCLAGPEQCSAQKAAVSSQASFSQHHSRTTLDQQQHDQPAASAGSSNRQQQLLAPFACHVALQSSNQCRYRSMLALCQHHRATGLNPPPACCTTTCSSGLPSQDSHHQLRSSWWSSQTPWSAPALS